MYRLTSALWFSLLLFFVLVALPAADAGAQQQSGGLHKGTHRNTRHSTSSHHQTRQRDNYKATYRSELSRAKSEWRHAQRIGTK